MQASSAEIFGSPPSRHRRRPPRSRRHHPTAPRRRSRTSSSRVYRARGLPVSCILYNHESPRRPPTFVTRKITPAAARIAATGARPSARQPGRTPRLGLGAGLRRRDGAGIPPREAGRLRHRHGRARIPSPTSSQAAFARAGIEDWERTSRSTRHSSGRSTPRFRSGDAAKAAASPGLAADRRVRRGGGADGRPRPRPRPRGSLTAVTSSPFVSYARTARTSSCAAPLRASRTAGTSRSASTNPRVGSLTYGSFQQGWSGLSSRPKSPPSTGCGRSALEMWSFRRRTAGRGARGGRLGGPRRSRVGPRREGGQSAPSGDDRRHPVAALGSRPRANPGATAEARRGAALRRLPVRRFSRFYVAADKGDELRPSLSAPANPRDDYTLHADLGRPAGTRRGGRRAAPAAGGAAGGDLRVALCGPPARGRPPRRSPRSRSCASRSRSISITSATSTSRWRR